MKKLCLLTAAICLLISLPVKSQMEKGKVLTSVTSTLTPEDDLGSDMMRLGFSTNKYGDDSDNYKEISFNLQPRVGYFVIDNLVAGLDIIAGICSETDKNDPDYKWSETLLAAGPFIRYYYPLEKIYPFAEANAIFGTMKNKYYEDEQNWSYMQLSLGVGGAFPLGDRVTFDALLSYGYIKGKDKDQESGYDETNSGIGIRLGFTIFFLKK